MKDFSKGVDRGALNAADCFFITKKTNQKVEIHLLLAMLFMACGGFLGAFGGSIVFYAIVLFITN